MARHLLSILIVSLGTLMISENLAFPNPQFVFPYYHSVFYPYHQKLLGPYYQPSFGPYYPSGPPNWGEALVVSNRNETRVSGGFHLPVGMVPFLVALRIPDAKGEIGDCGGTLITSKHVLTAAHCFDLKDLETPLGMEVYINTLTKTPFGPPEQAIVRVVGKIDVHEKYEKIPPNELPENQLPNEYDIAVLTLTQEVTTVKPVQLANCIQTTAAEDKSTAFGPGWGGTELETNVSPILLGTVLFVLSNDECRKDEKGIKETQICSAYIPGGRDVCGGDSGGPLLVGSTEKGFIQLGIVSYGPPCDPNKYLGPGVYARVCSFIDWIKTKTEGLLLQ